MLRRYSISCRSQKGHGIEGSEKMCTLIWKWPMPMAKREPTALVPFSSASGLTPVTTWRA